MPFPVINSIKAGYTKCVSTVKYFLVEPLTSEDGRLSFAKLVLVSIVVAQFVGRPFAIGMALAVVSASYGPKMWQSFLDSKGVTSHEEAKFEDTHDTRNVNLTNKTTIETYEKRSLDDGTEPTP
jgi:hypothetical protein